VQVWNKFIDERLQLNDYDCFALNPRLEKKTRNLLTTGVQKALLPVPAAGEHGADLPCCFDRHDLGRMRLAVADARLEEVDDVADGVTVAPPSDDDAPEDVFDLCIAAAATYDDGDAEATMILSLVMTKTVS
jgi:hypothetical protein